MTVKTHQEQATMNEHQKQVYDEIARAASLTTPADAVHVEQTPTFLKEPMKIADFAVGVVGALGTSVAELGQARDCRDRTSPWIADRRP